MSAATKLIGFGHDSGNHCDVDCSRLFQQGNRFALRCVAGKTHHDQPVESLLSHWCRSVPDHWSQCGSCTLCTILPLSAVIILSGSPMDSVCTVFVCSPSSSSSAQRPELGPGIVGESERARVTRELRIHMHNQTTRLHWDPPRLSNPVKMRPNHRSLGWVEGDIWLGSSLCCIWSRVSMTTGSQTSLLQAKCRVYSVITHTWPMSIFSIITIYPT